MNNYEPPYRLTHISQGGVDFYELRCSLPNATPVYSFDRRSLESMQYLGNQAYYAGRMSMVVKPKKRKAKK